MIDKLLNLTISTSARRDDGSVVTLFRGIAIPANVESFVILDGRTGVKHDGTTMGAVALRIFREVFALAAPVVPQIESPIPAAERKTSGLAGGGAAANAMSTPVRDMLAVAAGARNGTIFRGARENGDYPRPMLQAAIRRGWLDAGGIVMFRHARITPLGRKALERELATSGGAR